MSSGVMAGSHEARLAHVQSGHLAPMNHGHRSFFKKISILVGPMSNSSKS